MQIAKHLAFVLLVPFTLVSLQGGKFDSQKLYYSGVTNDKRIIQALNCLDGTNGEWSKRAILGNNLSGKPVKVMFKDLTKISPKCANFDALGWRDTDGQLEIFINKSFSQSPPEAIASILAHEAIHQDKYTSIDEETYGWGMEASVWMQMKKKNPELKNFDPNLYPLVSRLNALEKMYADANNTTSLIKQAVSANPEYKDLPETSPGFDK